MKPYIYDINITYVVVKDCVAAENVRETVDLACVTQYTILLLD